MNLEKYCDQNEVDWQAGQEYLESLLRHIAYVQEAGQEIGVKMDRLRYHDGSKFSSEEFPHYAQHFFGTKDNDEEFALAWNHHENYNDHHWGHWIARSGKYTGVALPMSQKAIKEMVADWMGASKEYTGSWDMTEWLNSSYPKINLHEKTRIIVANGLEHLGYKRTGELFHD